LKKIPFLSKKTIKKTIDDFKAKNFPENKFEVNTTGGSTGFPLRFYVEKDVAQAIHKAFFQIFLDQFNCHFTNKQVNLISNDNICTYSIFRRIMILSSLYMSDKNIPTYIKKIKNLKPKFILAFPTALFKLAKYMNKNQIESFPSLKAVICSGEIIFDWQRNLFEKTFNCRIYSLYAHNEIAVFGTSCPVSNNYHMYPEYGIVELINKNGEQVTKEGESGEIVVTGFNNYIFPFIRYKTEDIGILTLKKCSCGRNYFLLKQIIGRIQDFIVTKDKRLIPLTGFYGLIAKVSDNVKNCQLLQEEEGKLILNIIKDDNYTEKDEKAIKTQYQKRFNKDINLTIQYVDSISSNPAGKFQFLIQKLPIDY
jgi:phenylacetate-CoA ligase